jgi:3-mercaptopropionate dioxygenase
MDDQLRAKPEKLQRFIEQLTELVSTRNQEAAVLNQAHHYLSQLIEHDDWLPKPFAQPRADRYAQYLLHCDPASRFSVVSFVWVSDQKTPVHNHTIWGLVGVLRGAERCDEYSLDSVFGRPISSGHSHVVTAGKIDSVSPSIGDWHRVSNMADLHRPEMPTVSIHVYGGDIGKIRRQRLTDTGEAIEFVSGYDNTSLQSFS